MFYLTNQKENEADIYIINRSNNHYRSISLDRAYEQTIKRVKGVQVRITENPEQLEPCIAVEPEINLVLKQFTDAENNGCQELPYLPDSTRKHLTYSTQNETPLYVHRAFGYF